MRHPVVSVVGAAAVLLALAAPALVFKSDNGALRQFPAGNEMRQGVEAAARITGPGALAPVQDVVARDDAAAAVRIARADNETARVAPPVPSADGRHALVTVIPRHDGESGRPRRSSPACATTCRAAPSSVARRPAASTTATSCRGRCGRSRCSSSASHTSCCSRCFAR
jgi:hypothetical protein